MAQRLKGKSAVVTGSGRGIGRGIALALAREGAQVVINDPFRGPDGVGVADNVVREIKKAGGSAVANYDSVGTMASGESIIKTAVSNFGKIDILANVAANFSPAGIVETSEQLWDLTMTVHLKGHFACTRAAVAEMIKQKSGGRIFCFSSRGAFFAKGVIAYCTAKAGVMGFSGELARDLKQYGITVNCILPSAVTQLFPAQKTPLGDHVPIPENADPDLVAPIVAYLSTDEAKGITGQYVYAAGGDVVFYAQPLDFAYSNRMVRKVGGAWTMDELDKVIPPMAALD